MTDAIVVVPYSPDWPTRFERIGENLRAELDAVAIRIDHIGSTAIEGMAAKPIIDILLSVQSLTPEDVYRGAIEDLGYAFRPNNPDKTKRFFRDPPGLPRTVHIHVVRDGSLGQQLVLVFRDYLRTHPEDAQRYADLKQKLADRFHDDPERYVSEKNPLIWEIIQRANDWSQQSGWQPGEADA